MGAFDREIDVHTTVSVGEPTRPQSGPRTSGFPWRGCGHVLVLFVDEPSGGDEATFFQLTCPRQWQRAVVHAERDRVALEWFGIREFPTLAVVVDACLVAVEQGCDVAAVRSLEHQLWARPVPMGAL